MNRISILTLLFYTACTEKDDINVPGGSQNNSTNNNNNTVEVTFDCPSEWTEGNGYWVDPVTCTAWSSMTQELDWYQATNPSQAQDGGCNEHCDNNDQNHCADMSLDGMDSWRLPSIDELEELSLRAPPIPDTEGDLWSFNSDSFDGMAWTANLGQEGMFFLLEKDTLAAVRCVTP
jgi:hypothetical protein